MKRNLHNSTQLQILFTESIASIPTVRKEIKKRPSLGTWKQPNSPQVAITYRITVLKLQLTY